MGEPASPSDITKTLESLKVNCDAVEAFERIQEHLADNEEVVDNKQLVLGPWLKIDSDAERFIDNPTGIMVATASQK